MEIMNLTQGSQEWHEFRIKHFTASEAPAMLGVSKYQSRDDLLRLKHSGVEPEVTGYQQKIFDDGHRFEALARQLAESLVGEELFPITGRVGKLSASFDGITMLHDVIWEHKTLNKSIKDCLTVHDLPEQYRVQMEQQLLVSGAEKCLFMASKFDENGELVDKVVFKYMPDMALRQRIIDGWEQFEKDLASYVPQEIEIKQKAAPIMSLPGIAVQVTGMVTSSNLDAYKAEADAFFAGLPKANDLNTDNDFVQAKELVKYCEKSEKELDQAKANILGQTESIDSVIKLIDHIKAEFRAKRLELDKVTKAREQYIKEKIVADANTDFDNYIGMLITLGYADIKPYFKPERPQFAVVCKSKAIAGYKAEVPKELARAKTTAQSLAEHLLNNYNWLMDSIAKDYLFLFNDLADLLHKDDDSLQAVVAMRVQKQQQADSERLEAERERIRQEEALKVQAQQVQQVQAQPEPQPSIAPTTEHFQLQSTASTQSANQVVITEKTLTLGKLGLILGIPLSSEYLRSIGVMPDGKQKASLLYSSDKVFIIAEKVIENMQKVIADFSVAESKKAA